MTGLCSPISMHWAGNERDENRGLVHTFPNPDGGLTAGLHYSVFTMQSRPIAPKLEREKPRQVRTGPSPFQVLTRGRHR